MALEAIDRPTTVWLRIVRKFLSDEVHDTAAAVTDLTQTTTNPPTQAEVQAIANKVDELMQSLRDAGIMET